jgi:MoaA/NifB/PqqE/SkfB family radical SAM enzyme
MAVNWQLYHWHIELSSRCTLKCPRCPRTEFPETPWLNQDISLKEFKEAFTPEFIISNVQRFTFCGDVGDPIYNKEFLEIVQYVKEVKPSCHTFTITNGSYRKPAWWEELASILNEYDSINFSVDGYDHDSNNLYRVNSDFDSIMAGMRIMGHRSSAFINWAAIYFRFNQDHQDSIRSLAIQNGCDAIQWTKSTKFGSKYGEAYDGIDDALEPREEFISATHRYERHVEHLTDRRIQNERYMQTNKTRFEKIQKEYSEHIVPLCLVGNRGMYISADGVVHPCSWVSFPYKELSDGIKTIKYENSFFSNNRKYFSIKTRSLIEILNDEKWVTLTNTWNNPNKSWVECNLKCQQQYVDFDYGVGYETN